MSWQLIKQSIKTRKQRERFFPTWISLFYSPSFLINRALSRELIALSPRLSGKLLDFGCGSKPYRELFSVDNYLGVDIEQSGGHDHINENIDVFYDGRSLPFSKAEFDSVFASEVFEHIFNLETILSELHRVLKPGGQMLISLPFLFPEHERPYDFARYTQFGIRHLLEKAGFLLVEQRTPGHAFEVIAQLYITTFDSMSRRLPNALRLPLRSLIIFPSVLIAIFMSWIFPDQPELYFSNVILAQKQLTAS